MLFGVKLIEYASEYDAAAMLMEIAVMMDLKVDCVGDNFLGIKCNRLLPIVDMFLDKKSLAMIDSLLINHVSIWFYTI